MAIPQTNGQRNRPNALDHLPRRDVRVAKLKLGEKVEGRANPTKLDYIKAVDGMGNKMTAFHEVYGDKPKCFRAVFASGDIEDVLWSSYRTYGRSGEASWVGDGVTFFNQKTGEETEQVPAGVKLVTYLQLKVLGLDARKHGLLASHGIFQITTSSEQSTNAMRWFIEELRNEYGRIEAIPFKVFIEHHSSSKGTYWLWRFDTDLDSASAEEAATVEPEVAEFDESVPEDIFPEVPVERAPAAAAEDDLDFGRTGEEVSAALQSASRLRERVAEAKKARKLTAPQAQVALAKLDELYAKFQQNGDVEGFVGWVDKQDANLAARMGVQDAA